MGVRDLPLNGNDLYIYTVFAPFGAIEAVQAILAEDGTCKGLGFVNFARASDAAKAIAGVSGRKQHDGTVLNVAVNFPPHKSTPHALRKGGGPRAHRAAKTGRAKS